MKISIRQWERRLEKLSRLVSFANGVEGPNTQVPILPPCQHNPKSFSGTTLSGRDRISPLLTPFLPDFQILTSFLAVERRDLARWAVRGRPFRLP